MFFGGASLFAFSLLHIVSEFYLPLTVGGGTAAPTPSLVYWVFLSPSWGLHTCKDDDSADNL